MDTLYSETPPRPDMMTNRRETLEVKLNVLSKTLQTRIGVYQKTMTSLEDAVLEAMQPVERITTLKEYGLPYPREELINAKRDLSTMHGEIRSRDSECWKDITGLMRDILQTWEELQAAKTKEAMMHDE